MAIAEDGTSSIGDSMFASTNGSRKIKDEAMTKWLKP